MQYVIENIRKSVVLVLLMEVVLQLQSGKQYEPYIKMLIGIMVVYSLVSGIFNVWSKVEEDVLVPMQEFQWTGNWYTSFENQAEAQMEESAGENTGFGEGTSGDVDNIEVQVDITPVTEIMIDEVTAGS